MFDIVTHNVKQSRPRQHSRRRFVPVCCFRPAFPAADRKRARRSHGLSGAAFPGLYLGPPGRCFPLSHSPSLPIHQYNNNFFITFYVSFSHDSFAGGACVLCALARVFFARAARVLFVLVFFAGRVLTGAHGKRAGGLYVARVPRARGARGLQLHKKRTGGPFWWAVGPPIWFYLV